MIKAYFNDNEIISTGKVNEGDNYQNFCCNGFGWKVCLIFPEEQHPKYTEVWGVCQNEDCPRYAERVGPDDPYRGVGTISLEDLEEWVAQNDPA